MLRTPIELAREGMELAVPVFHPLTGTRLLAEDFRIDEKSIRRLAELGVMEIWIRYPHTELIRNYVSPRVIQRQSIVLATVTQAFHELHRNVHANLDYADYKRGISDLIGALLEEPAAASYVQEMAGQPASDFRHAAAVSIISLLLGLKLQGYLIQERPRLKAREATRVVNLALGGMLHDVGLLRLKEADRARLRDRLDENDPAWLCHSSLGYRMLSGKIDPTAAVAVLQHHRYFDGTGFPVIDADHAAGERVRGHDIHVFARIICVADHYDRLRHAAAGRGLLRVETLSRMVRPPLSNRFDPHVLRALFDVIPAYVPGTVVRLNTGDRAVVVGWDPAFPCRPTVQVVGPGESEPVALVRTATSQPILEPIYHDLRRCPDLEIVEQDGVDVRHLNFDLDPFESGEGDIELAA